MRKGTAGRVVAGAMIALAALASVAAESRAQDLTDAEVAHVAVTANTIDADLGKVALERGVAAEVKAFARTMVDDHTGVNRMAGELVTKLGVTPADNAVSASLNKDAEAAKAKLVTLSGAAFDRAYMDREVAYHQAVLDAIDKVLVPTTENPELKDLLGTVRPAIAAHLDRARGIQRALGT